MTARRYATPAAFKAAVEQRLRREASSRGVDLQRRRQLFIFDRLLCRIFPVLGDAVTLKGGLAIEARLGRARTTKDIDLRVTGDPSGVLARLQEAGRLDLGDHLRFEVAADPRCPTIDAPGMAYQGSRYRAQAYLATKVYGATFGIDVAIAGPMRLAADLVEGSSFLEFAGFESRVLRVYPLEIHVAEKLHAYTAPRDRPNSRIKDLPDLAILATIRDVDGPQLLGTIEQTFTQRGTHPVPGSVPDPPASWSGPYARIAASDKLTWRTLNEVSRAVRSFLDPILAGRARRWRAASGTWEGGQP